MLSISGIGSADDAADYYENLSERDDYYLESGEPPGQWEGHGCAALGLDGQIEREQFRRVLAGFNPKTGGARVSGAGDGHRPGWDCTFSAPKSVSACWAVAGGADRDAIQAAHDSSVRAALMLLEDEAATARRGSGGAEHERAAGLVAAVYQHAASRAQEPQVHSHAVIANMAPRSDGTWGALDGRPLYQWKMAVGAAYRAELASTLTRQGFQIEADSDSFRVAGVPDRLCRRWSSRAAEIDAAAEARGATTAKGREAAALSSRQTKNAVDRPALFQRWQAEAAGMGFCARQVAELRVAEIGQERGEELSAGQTDEQILAELTERRSVFRRTDVFRAAAVAEQTRGGGLDAARARAETILANAAVVRLRGADGRHVYTTREMLAIEAGIRDTAQARNAERQHICPTTAVTAAANTRMLSDEQAQALRYLTGDSGGVAALIGDAGTGKSYLMAAAREAWEANNYRVRGCALAGKAADGLQSGSGIRSQTLHSLLADLGTGRAELGRRDVIVLDEAGMVGARQLAELTRRADQAGAKIVLVGDHKQLQPIQAGAAFRHVAEATHAARLADIRRQAAAADREIVRDFASGRADMALAKLAGRGQFQVADTGDAARAAVVAGWAADRDPAQPGECLMIAGTRRDVALLNGVARERAAAAGELGHEHRVRLGDDGPSLALAEGDRILFTRNSRLYDVRNGQLGSVSALRQREDGSAVLEIERDGGSRITIDTGEYSHLAHGYALTAHKSQGVTVDHAHILASEMMSDREWSYVAASRARSSTQIYADRATAADLGRTMTRSRQAESSLDYKATP